MRADEGGLLFGQDAALLGQRRQTQGFVQADRAGPVAGAAGQAACRCMGLRRQGEIGHDGADKDIAAIDRMDEQPVFPDAAQTGAGRGVDLGERGVVGKYQEAAIWMRGAQRLRRSFQMCGGNRVIVTAARIEG